MTEKEKMLAGKLYFAEDEELSGLRRRARNLCHEFNATNEDEKPRRREIIRSLVRTYRAQSRHTSVFSL